jgi:hypothetical protein
MILIAIYRVGGILAPCRWALKRFLSKTEFCRLNVRTGEGAQTQGKKTRAGLDTFNGYDRITKRKPKHHPLQNPQRMGHPSVHQGSWSVVVGLSEEFMPKTKTSRFDHCLGPGKKSTTFLIWFVFKNHLNDNWATLSVWISHEYFATFNESKVLIEFRLQGGLVRDSI